MNDPSVEGRAFPRVVQRLVWLRRHRQRVLLLTFLGIATAFLLDLLIPGYAIAGFYLIPLMLVAFAVHERLSSPSSASSAWVWPSSRWCSRDAPTLRTSSFSALACWRASAWSRWATCTGVSICCTRPNDPRRPSCTPSPHSCRGCRRCPYWARTGHCPICSITSSGRHGSCSTATAACSSGTTPTTISSSQKLRSASLSIWQRRCHCRPERSGRQGRKGTAAGGGDGSQGLLERRRSSRGARPSTGFAIMRPVLLCRSRSGRISSE